MKLVKTTDGQELEILAIHGVPISYTYTGPTGNSYPANEVESWATVRDSNQKVKTIKIDGLTITGE